MLKLKDILDEKNLILRKVCKDVSFPFKYKKLVNDMMEYLEKSQDEKYAEKNNLRPGIGLAASQLGIAERFLVIVHEQEDGSFNKYAIINPKIISHSEELIYAGVGEGCLSINREVEGIVPRYARVTIEGYNINGDKIKIRAREELSIAFQHEIDHLEGILFIDYIDKKDPFKNSTKMRMI
ncbi:MAG: peptide deformylase [Bacilli bacterium]